MVVAQLLCDCGSVVKGGRTLEIRYGLAATRASSDLDTVRVQSPERFVDCLQDALEQTWAGFGGRIRDRGVVAAPVPDAYRPHRLEVVLTYLGEPGVGTVTLEIAIEEVDGLADADTIESRDAMDIFASVGLPAPNPVAVLGVHVQIAQKLHACTTPDEDGWINERAHDLIDLQLLRRDVPGEDLSRLRETSERLFASRKRHPWPPTVTARDGWGARYAAEREGPGTADVIESLDAAVDWANRFVEEIATA